MSIFLSQALQILNQIELEEPAIAQAKELLGSLHKTAAISDALSDPRLTNALMLLVPFIANYKVNQVVKLLKELQEQGVKRDPNTGLPRKI